jgi:hypothetical protein
VTEFIVESVFPKEALRSGKLSIKPGHDVKNLRMVFDDGGACQGVMYRNDIDKHIFVPMANIKDMVVRPKPAKSKR